MQLQPPSSSPRALDVEVPSRLSAPWRWARLAVRVIRLWRRGALVTPELLRRSYDAAAPGYDKAWTEGMRDRTVDMLQRLRVRPGEQCLDLTCGTGYVTAWLQERSRVEGGKWKVESGIHIAPRPQAPSGGRIVGVDASAGMLAQARAKCPCAEFVQSDILEFLRAAPAKSFDVVTCAWGLGYSYPRQVIAEIGRVLRPGGRVGIIDNSLWSLREVVWASVQTFALMPEALEHVLRVRFLSGSLALRQQLQVCGLACEWSQDGQRSFVQSSGAAAIQRLRSTGAAAGFEFAESNANEERVYQLFARQLERRWGAAIPVTHRYLAAVACKPGLGQELECRRRWMAWLSLTRPARSVLLTVPLPLTFYYLRGAWPLPAGDWWAAAGLLLVLAGGFAVNDAADAPYDCGKGTGAIVSGRIPRHAAAVLGVVLMAVGCWLAAALAQRGFAVSLAAVALALLAYDTCSKQLGLLKAAVVGVLVASTYLLARAQVGHWGGERAATIPFFATWMLLSATAYEIYSDVRDRHSDAAGGGGPRAIQSHPRKWMRAADGLMAAGALMLLPPAFLSLNSIYLAATATLVGLSFIGLLRSHKPGTKLCWVVIEFVAVGIAVVLAGAE